MPYPTSLTEAAYGALSLAQAYIGTPVYNAYLRVASISLVGDFYQFASQPKASFARLQSEAKESDSGMAISDLGILGGKFAIIHPQSQEQLEHFLSAIDEEPTGRNSHYSFKFFTNNTFFLISDTGEPAIQLRKALSAFLVPSKFAEDIPKHLSQFTSEQENLKAREMLCGLVRAIMVKQILNIDELPESTYEVMEAYRQDVKKWGFFPLQSLMGLIPSLREKKSLYGQFSDEILQKEFEKTVRIIQESDSPKKETLIISTIFNLLRNENPSLSTTELTLKLKSLTEPELRKYFAHPIVRSLPMILKAADNLTDAIAVALKELGRAPELLSSLLHELASNSSLFQDAESRRLNSQVLKKLPLLDALYKESVRFDTPLGVPRYTARGITYGDVKIPAGTTILFDFTSLNKSETYWKSPETFNPYRFLDASYPESEYKLNKFPFIPFAVAGRRCPAIAVTENVFKSVIAEFVLQFDFSLDSSVELDDDFMLKIEHRSPELMQLSNIEDSPEDDLDARDGLESSCTATLN